MSTVLEEKMPMIHDYLIERYGQLSQSAVDAVAQGLKTAISMGIASSAQDKIETSEHSEHLEDPIPPKVC